VPVIDIELVGGEADGKRLVIPQPVEVVTISRPTSFNLTELALEPVSIEHIDYVRGGMGHDGLVRYHLTGPPRGST
jgi:hypothetical protein